MVIQCSQCQTRFKVADEKVKPEGIKVRCSKCKHIFTVTPASEVEPEFPEAAAPAVAPAPAPQPEADFSSGDADEGFAPPPGPEADSTDSEGDLGQFSWPTTEGGDEDFSTTAAPETDAAEAGGDFDTFSFEEQALEEPTPSFDFSFDEEPAAGGDRDWQSNDAAAAFSFDEPADDKKAGEFTFVTNEAAAGADEFDFSQMKFGDEEPALADLAPPPKSPAPAVKAEASSPAAAPTAPPSRPARRGKKRPRYAPASRSKGPFSGALVFFSVLLLALSGAAGYLYWQGGNVDLTWIMDRLTNPAAPPAPAGQIQLTGLTGSFVHNEHAGQLFVIRGQAVNDYQEARSAIAVKGVIYNREGRSLFQQTVFCGNPLDEGMLRSLPFAKIEERMNNQFGDSLSNLNVAPGKTIPFTIVFRDLPGDLAEFTVEVADSRPGSKQ